MGGPVEGRPQLRGLGLRVRLLRAWLAIVKREYETPDMWAELAQARDFAIGPALGDTENTVFDEEEQEQISAQLRELREYLVSTQELTGDQLRMIDARLGYLEEAARRTRRIDWRNLLVGSLISLVLEQVVPVTAIQAAFQFLGRALDYLFTRGGTPTLPGGPPDVSA
jgi:hypothetical protein